MKNFKTSLLVLSLAPSLFLATVANAELPNNNTFNYGNPSANYVDNTSSNGGTGNPYYFGGSFGTSEGTSYCSGAVGCTDSDTAWKLFGGYKLNDMFSVEGSYMNIGDMKKPGASSDVSAFAAHGVATLPVTEQIDVFGKLGVARWSSDNTGTSNESGFGFAYGVGAKMNLSETTKLRAEWEKIPSVKTSPTTDTNVTMMSVGVELSTY